MLPSLKNFSFFLLLIFFTPLLSAQTPAVEVKTYTQLVHAIRETRAAAETRIEKAVDAEKVREAWEIGGLIQKHILNNDTRAEYGKKLLKKLAKELDTSETELGYMLQFARAYPISRPAGKLTWSHYQALLSINDAQERETLAVKAEKENWGRDRLREEVQNRKKGVKTKAAPEIIQAEPGKLYTYRIVGGDLRPETGDNRLRIDLGFSAFLDLSAEDAKRFKVGDIVTAADPKSRNSGLKSQVSGLESDLYTYKATVIDIIDGDTIHASVDLGFGFTMNQTLRLRGLDAPEIESSDGKGAKEFLKNLLGQAQTITIKTSKSDKYDRYLVDVFVGDKYINQMLLEEGLAVAVRD